MLIPDVGVSASGRCARPASVVHLALLNSAEIGENYWNRTSLFRVATEHICRSAKSSWGERRVLHSHLTASQAVAFLLSYIQHCLVRVRGIEPPVPLQRRFLKPVCLPIPPHSHKFGTPERTRTVIVPGENRPAYSN